MSHVCDDCQGDFEEVLDVSRVWVYPIQLCRECAALLEMNDNYDDLLERVVTRRLAPLKDLTRGHRR